MSFLCRWERRTVPRQALWEQTGTMRAVHVLCLWGEAVALASPPCSLDPEQSSPNLLCLHLTHTWATPDVCPGLDI